MKKLNKNFTTETDELKSYISCSCPLCGCGCASDSAVQKATNSASGAATQDQSSYWNR